MKTFRYFCSNYVIDATIEGILIYMYREVRPLEVESGIECILLEAAGLFALPWSL
jgi:hypothetical protein